MENSVKTFQTEEFDMKRVFQAVLSRLWEIFLVAGIGMLLSITLLLYLSKGTYQQKITIATESENSDESRMALYLSDANTAATSASSMMTSNLILQNLEDLYGKEHDIQVFSTVIGNTNLFTVTVASDSAELTYRVINHLFDQITDMAKDIMSMDHILFKKIARSDMENTGLNFFQISIYSITIGIAIIAGFILLIAVQEFYRGTVNLKMQCYEKLGEAPIEVVPHMKKMNQISLVQEKNKLYYKVFDGLALKIQRIKAVENDSSKNSFMFVSNMSKEGTSSILFHTAIALASMGSSVVVFDLDVTNPTLSKMLGVTKESIMYEKDKTKGFLLSPNEEYPNLAYMGIANDNAEITNVVQSKNMLEYFEYVSKTTDFILINAPAIEKRVDAQLFNLYADYFFMVIRRNYSNAGDIVSSKNMLEKRDSKFAGYIFNDAYESDLMKTGSLSKMFKGRSADEK